MQRAAYMDIKIQLTSLKRFEPQLQLLQLHRLVTFAKLSLASLPMKLKTQQNGW